jgi:uncharacterized cupredoxin-like copper-binding protein
MARRRGSADHGGMHGPRTTVVGAAAILALAAAGCGSSGDSKTTTAAKPAATQAAGGRGDGGGGGKGGGGGGKALAVKETEFKIAPKDATVTAKGGKVTLKVTNAGSAVHALDIEEAAGDGKDVESGVISPGSSKTVTAAIKPGTYEWYCPIGDHRQEGMEGKITVKG